MSAQIALAQTTTKTVGQTHDRTTSEQVGGMKESAPEGGRFNAKEVDEYLADPLKAIPAQDQTILRKRVQDYKGDGITTETEACTVVLANSDAIVGYCQSGNETWHIYDTNRDGSVDKTIVNDIERFIDDYFDEELKKVIQWRLDWSMQYLTNYLSGLLTGTDFEDQGNNLYYFTSGTTGKKMYLRITHGDKGCIVSIQEYFLPTTVSIYEGSPEFNSLPAGICEGNHLIPSSQNH
jgi:hypothetical protein